MKPYVIGFTGTSRGMNALQKINLRFFLGDLFRPALNGEPRIEFHHGDCIGADDEAATIAKGIGFWVVAHPGFPKGKRDDTVFRAFNPHSDVVLDPKEFIARDHDIVDVSDYMVAAPHTDRELIRSGTWATVRYARKKNKPVTLVFPNRRIGTDGHPAIIDT